LFEREKYSTIPVYSNNQEVIMAFFNGTVYSEALHMDTSLGVILPQDSRLHRHPHWGLTPGITPRAKPKTFILLHGLSDNYSVWEHRTSLLRYAEAWDVAVLLPEVQRSFYRDMKNGPAYFTYISEELPTLAGEMFHLSVSPEDLYIAGLSMGGYGAMMAALRYPEKYAGVGCFSAVYNLKEVMESRAYDEVDTLAGLALDRRGVFGESGRVSEEDDPFALVPLAAQKPRRPPFFMTCGTEDFLYEANVKMRDLLTSTGAFQVTYEEWPGIHEWGFWDLSIQKMLKLFLDGDPRGESVGGGRITP
jgi:S-formylglutathione hydrolase FrmB